MSVTPGRVYERMSTCGMVSVSFVPPSLQHVVRCSEKHTYINLIDYTLCGTSECSHFGVFNNTASPDSNITGNRRVAPK